MGPPKQRTERCALCWLLVHSYAHESGHVAKAKSRWRCVSCLLEWGDITIFSISPHRRLSRILLSSLSTPPSSGYFIAPLVRWLEGQWIPCEGVGVLPAYVFSALFSSSPARLFYLPRSHTQVRCGAGSSARKNRQNAGTERGVSFGPFRRCAGDSAAARPRHLSGSLASHGRCIASHSMHRSYCMRQVISAPSLRQECAWLAPAWKSVHLSHDVLGSVLVFDIRHGQQPGMGALQERLAALLRVSRALKRCGTPRASPLRKWPCVGSPQSRRARAVPSPRSSPCPPPLPSTARGSSGPTTARTTAGRSGAPRAQAGAASTTRHATPLCAPALPATLHPDAASPRPAPSARPRRAPTSSPLAPSTGSGAASTGRRWPSARAPRRRGSCPSSTSASRGRKAAGRGPARPGTRRGARTRGWSSRRTGRWRSRGEGTTSGSRRWISWTRSRRTGG